MLTAPSVKSQKLPRHLAFDAFSASAARYLRSMPIFDDFYYPRANSKPRIVSLVALSSACQPDTHCEQMLRLCQLGLRSATTKVTRHNNWQDDAGICPSRQGFAVLSP